MRPFSQMFLLSVLPIQRIFLSLFLMMLVPAAVLSQEHHGEAMGEPGWETVLSGVSFFPTDSEIRGEEGVLFGTELHLTYWFTHTWALGVGYTVKFEHEGKMGSELALIGSYKPQKWITINAGPNFTLPTSHSANGLVLSGYLESEINYFLTPHLHLGPVVGGLLGSHSELFGGIHVGYEF